MVEACELTSDREMSRRKEKVLECSGMSNSTQLPEVKVGLPTSLFTRLLKVVYQYKYLGLQRMERLNDAGLYNLVFLECPRSQMTSQSLP